MRDNFQTTGQKTAATAMRTVVAATSQVDAEERRLVVQAVVVGVVVWAMVSLLKVAAHWGFHGLTSLMDHAPTVLFVLIPLTLGAVVVASIARFGRAVVYYRDARGHIHELNAVEGDGLERAIGLYFCSEPSTERALLGIEGVRARWELPTIKLALQKMLATFVTLSSGGSGGLEASVSLIGESTSAALFKPRGLLPAWARRWSRLERLVVWWQDAAPEDLRTAQLCGIAAAVATLLNTPFAAAFFAVEVMYRRRPIIDKLIYALISSLVAFFLAHSTGAESPFHAGRLAESLLFDGRYYVALLAVALSVSAVAVAFGKLRGVLEHFFEARIPNIWGRHVTGALLTGLVAFGAALVLRWEGSFDAVLGERGGPGAVVSLVLGSGEAVIEAALVGELTATVALVALVAKLLASLTTITSGGSAGLLFPTMFFGTAVAVIWAAVFGYSDPVVLIAPALTASLVSIVNVPIAAIFIVVELFGADWLVPSLFMLVVVSIVTHENSIYRTQHDSFDSSEVLPGIVVRDLDVPARLVGQSLQDIDIRKRFGLTVVGIRDNSIEGAVELNPAPDRVLAAGEELVVLGDPDGFARWSQSAADADG